MTIFAPPRAPVVEDALAVAKQWCAGRTIDDRPALTHAARVAVTVGEHQPDVDADVVAAALLHDAPEFAPATLDLDGFLDDRFGAEVRRLIRGMQSEHDAIDRQEPVIPDPADGHLMLLSTADKVVALRSLLRRAGLSGDVTAFFARRRPLLDLLAFFRTFQRTSVDAVPASLSAALDTVLVDLAEATAAVSRS
ncbi:HD domain-containing protein [Micromonospora sp. WMMA1363]|uniref:HD domain-containing protein n=1 Tax=Micromonospora sp. WMMA1363 TaxID=3053985 RepID=UPI00259CAF81|nr:HD domain-containing protein [Micromonospora sp. WMMA1363]MDM4723275.1 HD domain-containing protein [Micromonospora sp. WMMA1363]MDM4723369.1 HD domain-containing protein [Micromonospora sp. WMMA1363]